MATKPNMKYRVDIGRNPSTGAQILVPRIVERESYDGKRLLEYAINMGYVRGQYYDLLGSLNGFNQAMKVLVQSGKAVNLSNWLRIHAELTGSVGEDRKLTAANALNVNVTALQDMKLALDDFGWTNVNDTGVKVKITDALYVGGLPGFLKKGKAAMLTGKNLQFDASLGDTLKISAAALATPVSVTPSESDYAHIKFTLPATVVALADNAELTLTLTSRGGVSGAADQVNTKVVKLLAADPVPSMTKVYAEANPTRENHIQCFEEINDLVGVGLDQVTGIKFTWTSPGETPEPMSLEGTIVSKTATLLKFKIDEVQFGECDGHLVVAYPDGEVTSTFGVIADEPA